MESTLSPESPEPHEPASPGSLSREQATGEPSSPDRDRDLVALSELEAEFGELERELDRVERSGNDERVD